MQRTQKKNNLLLHNPSEPFDLHSSHIFYFINPNQLSPGQKCPGHNFFFNALFVSEHFKHFEIYLFLTHFGG